MSLVAAAVSIVVGLLAITAILAGVLAVLRSKTMVESNDILRKERDDRDSRIDFLEQKMARQEQDCRAEVAELRGQVTALSDGIVSSTIASLQSRLITEIVAAIANREESP